MVGVLASFAPLKVFASRLDPTWSFWKDSWIPGFDFFFLWLYGRVLHCCFGVARWVFFSFVKKLFSSWVTEIQRGEKPVRKRCSSSLQISLESRNSTTPEQSPFPTAAAHPLSGGWANFWPVRSETLRIPSIASRSRLKSPPARSAAVVRRALSQGSTLCSSEINLPRICQVGQEGLAALGGKGWRASLSFRACRGWFRWGLVSTVCSQNSKSWEVQHGDPRGLWMKISRGWNHYMEPRSFHKDLLVHIWHCPMHSRSIIVSVFGEYDTQMSGVALPYSAGSGRTDTELDLISLYWSQSTAQYPWTVFPLFAIFQPPLF